MNMTDQEIATMYRDAKNKPEQIKILADMNCCEAIEIEDVLIKQGYNIEKKEKRKMTRARKDGYQPTGTEKNTEPPKGGSAVQAKEEKHIEIPEAVKEAVTQKMIECTEAIEKNSNTLKELSDFMQQCH